MTDATLHRKEDRRLLTGQGRYLADLVRPDTAHVALLRSPVAHARIRGIDVSAALAHPGVLAVVTQDDLEGQVQRMHHHLPMLPGLRQVQWPLLAAGKVRFAGEPVVAVVATSRAVAEDAVDLIRLDVDPLPPLTSVDDATADGAPLVYDDWTDNVLLRLEVVHGDPAAAIDGGDHAVLRTRVVHHRVTGAPLEGHGALADYEPGTGRLVLHASTQSPHFLRTVVAEALRLPESRLRVVAPDIGGAFGNKGHYLREEILVAALAHRLARPVVWSQDRVEGMTAGIHSRQQVHDIEIAHRPDGRIVAMRARLRADLGSAEVYALGMAPAFATAGTLPSVYDIQDYAFVVEGIVTNKAPNGGYRGYGQPQAVLSMDRVIDLLADHLGLDPVAVRRTNLIPDGVRPYVTAGGSRLDVGPLTHQLDELLSACGYGELRRQRDAARAGGRLVGIGVAQMVETTAANPHALAGQFGGYEMATVTVHPDGHVTAAVGTTSHGQGHETVYAKLVADALTVSPGTVEVREGDTDAVAYGAGTWGSRSAVMGGGALLLAAERVREKMIAVAAAMLHRPPDEVELVDGAFRAGDAALPLPLVANVATLHAFAAPSVEPGLTATVCFEPGNTQAFPDERGKMNMAATHSSGSGLAVVEVDVATGRVHVREATILHDCGRIIDRLIVEGQIQGGFAQGLGLVLLEVVEYRPDGSPAVRTLQDYPMPTARDVPVVRVLHQETPSALPGGFRGMGESAAILAPTMIVNAVHDALRPLGVAIAQSDLRPPSLRDLLRAAGAGLDLDEVAARALAGGR
ncbi:MAG: xanthine dehydrogenase family protein molybdopterin-binding subunit [Frankiaceae bacterium]